MYSHLNLGYIGLRIFEVRVNIDLTCGTYGSKFVFFHKDHHAAITFWHVKPAAFMHHRHALKGFSAFEMKFAVIFADSLTYWQGNFQYEWLMLIALKSEVMPM